MAIRIPKIDTTRYDTLDELKAALKPEEYTNQTVAFSTNKIASSNGTVWQLASGGRLVEILEDLADVAVEDIENGQVIAWNAEYEEWENVTPISGKTTIEGLEDVTVTDVKKLNGLLYNETSKSWINNNLAEDVVKIVGEFNNKEEITGLRINQRDGNPYTITFNLTPGGTPIKNKNTGASITNKNNGASIYNRNDQGVMNG